MIALVICSTRRYVSPSLSRCCISFGSASTSFSRTSAAFSNFCFLRNSVAESLRARVSTCGFLAMGDFVLTLLRLCCLVSRRAGGAHSPLGIMLGQHRAQGGFAGARATGGFARGAVVAPQVQ